MTKTEITTNKGKVSDRKVSDEIHGKRDPRPFGDWKGAKETIWSMMRCFRATTNV